MDYTVYNETQVKIAKTEALNDYDDWDLSEHKFPNTLWHVRSPTEMAIKSTLMVAIAVMGIFLNSIILIILFKNKWLRSPSNYLIGNLAFTDLLMLVLSPWFMLIRDFYQKFILQNFGCRFEGFMQATFLLASVSAVMLVSYDRLAAAALTTEAKITMKVAPKLVIASWLLSISLSIPWIVKRTYVERQWLDYLETFCAEDVQVLSIYWHFLLTMLVWVPLAAMVITYGAIMWQLERSSRELSSRGGGRAIAKARSRAMRITAFILVAAVVCRVPYTILIYWKNNLDPEINSVDGSFNIMWFVANCMMYLNSSINPLIYGFTNMRFKKAMDRTRGVAWFRFGSWCCVRPVCTRRKKEVFDKNTDKIFVIENSPRENRKLSRVIKNILHINMDSVEVTIKADDVTAKPTKVTPLKTEHF